MHALLISLLLIATALSVTGCASNPATGGTSVVVSSQSREATIGEEMHTELIEEGARYNDEELQAYVDRIGQRLVANSDMPNKEFTFTVIDSPDINAFALPGGYIYINRGLLAYLENEAELAGVLGHEIGHVTARHHGRRQTALMTTQMASLTAYILTGSGDLATATTMYGAELISGYGRDQELEADALGARYMHSAGYDTENLLEVLGVLKDQEQFQRVKAKAGGKPTQTYHGLYASHPRNDQRLRTVVREAGQLDQETFIEDPSSPGEFRRRLEGLVWGESVQGEQAENRYYHTKLDFTFEHPPGWKVNAGSSTIIATALDGSADMTLSLKGRKPEDTPQSVLESNAGGELRDGEKLEQAGLIGYTAVSSKDGESHRLAVIQYKNLFYLFDGKASDFPATDAELLALVESFRPIHPRERRAANPRRIEYIQVPRGATLSSLAASMRIPDAEAQLRLINGFYPRGEPRTGDWIKIIR